MRIVLFTGKGGVGKTSIAAATALKASELGYRTLVMSTDPAHSLSDSFSVKLGNTPVKIRQNLYGQEIDTQQKIEENWGAAKSYLATFITFQGLNEVVAEELAVLPGMDELFSLIEIKNYYEKKSFDFLVIDCAPTGATLRLLSFPDIASWYIRNIFPIQRKAAKIIRPVSSRLTKTPIPQDSVFSSFKNVYEKAELVKEILSDEKITSVRLVLNPEKMVIKEAQRAYTYLNLFGFPVDCVIANRVMPEEITDPYFSEWKTIQKQYIKTVEEAFSPLPIFKARLFNTEVVGFELLKKMAEDIYNGNDPTEIFYRENPLQIFKRDSDFVLKLKLHFVSKEEIDLKQKGDEIIIKTVNFKRNIYLPDTLVGKTVKEAKFVEDGIEIVFFGKK
jgi:arsenite-transporting ATPase